MRVEVRFTAGPWSRATTVLYASALLFLVAGSALVLLARFGDPPRLDQLTRVTGLVGAKRLHVNNRGAPYLEFTIDGGRYTIASYRRAWLDSISRALPVGERVVVWSREVPNGSGQIFQLQRGDSSVVPYLERRQRVEYQNRRSRQVGEAMILLAAAGAITGWAASRVAARRQRANVVG